MASGDASMLTHVTGLFQNLQNTLGIGAGSGRYPLVEVRSTVDGKIYRVRDMRDKQQAADLLAKVRIRMQRLYDHLQKTYPDKPQVKRLLQRFEANPERILEATPDAEHTSYSVNKGEKVHLCLRQRQGGDESLVNENIMVFVSLHEMGHMITDSIGHEAEFWNNFGWLLREAEKIGVYQYQDFKAHPVRYCGTSITDQPRYDAQKDGSDLSIGTLKLD
jgi:hypothetical protein